LVIVFDPLAVLMLIAATKTANSTVAPASPIKPVVEVAPHAGIGVQASLPQVQTMSSSKPVVITSRQLPHMTWYNQDGKLTISTPSGWKTFERVLPLFFTNGSQSNSSSAKLEQVVTKHEQTIVQKQEIDLRELQSAMESVLNSWLSSSLSVAKPLDPSVIKDMIKQAITERTPQELPEITPSLENNAPSPAPEEELRPYHPKMLAKEYQKSLKQP